MTKQNVNQSLRLIRYRTEHLINKLILYSNITNHYRLKQVPTCFEHVLSLEICACSREICFFILLVSNLIISFDEKKMN